MPISDAMSAPEKNSSRTILWNLPKHEVPTRSHRALKLSILGDVVRPLVLSPNQLRAFPTVKLSEDFRCLEGWVVKDVFWEGVPVSALLRAAGRKRSAKFLLFRAGDYTYTMDLKTALKNTTMLALRQSGKRLTTSRGGPMRLVFKGHDCYESVKWVESIDLLTKRSRSTARKIALSRISRPQK